MNADTLPRKGLPINAEVLRWAREWRGRTVEGAAQRANVTPEKVRAWEAGDSVPTVRQARLLAALYERPFLEFFLSRIPKVAERKLAPDFRLHRGAPDPGDDRELAAIQDWATDTRNDAIDLFGILGETPPTVSVDVSATLDTSPEWTASEVRRLSSFPIEAQLRLKSHERDRVAKDIRRAMERLGVLVLKESKLRHFGVRGLTLFADPLPVVIFGAEAPTAQAFTLAHELGHIALGQSAISGPPSARHSSSLAERSERWCDEFAGAFLVPSSALSSIWLKPNQPQPEIGDELLAQLANTFSISKHAMLIRLTHLGYVQDSFYWDVKRPEFVKQEAEYKGGGRPQYYGSRFRNAHGDLYTSLVLEAWGSGRITNHNAAEFMGTKSLSHLFDIRDNFSS